MLSMTNRAGVHVDILGNADQDGFTHESSHHRHIPKDMCNSRITSPVDVKYMYDYNESMSSAASDIVQQLLARVSLSTRVF